MTDRKKLRQAAEKAGLSSLRLQVIGEECQAEFIALASPKAIIALLDELDRKTVGEVGVKPLVWEPDHVGGGLRAGEYRLRAGIWTHGYYWLRGEDDPHTGYTDEDEAKAAAQADYEARIRRALAPSPAIGRETVTEEMVERGCEQAGWLVEPYTAPREGGLAVDTDISESDAEAINAQMRTAMREILEAALGAQP